MPNCAMPCWFVASSRICAPWVRHSQSGRSFASDRRTSRRRPGARAVSLARAVSPGPRRTPGVRQKTQQSRRHACRPVAAKAAVVIDRSLCAHPRHPSRRGRQRIRSRFAPTAFARARSAGLSPMGMMIAPTFPKKKSRPRPMRRCRPPAWSLRSPRGNARSNPDGRHRHREPL